MMRTAPQPGGWQLGPSLAAGLTLRFYKAFQMSASLTKLKERVAREEPEYEKYLIHVLVSTKAGELYKSLRFAQYQFIDAGRALEWRLQHASGEGVL
jgi:hypothetical protein